MNCKEGTLPVRGRQKQLHLQNREILASCHVPSFRHQIQIKLRLHCIDERRNPQHADAAGADADKQYKGKHADLNIEQPAFMSLHKKAAVPQQLFYGTGGKVQHQVNSLGIDQVQHCLQHKGGGITKQRNG